MEIFIKSPLPPLYKRGEFSTIPPLKKGLPHKSPFEKGG